MKNVKILLLILVLGIPTTILTRKKAHKKLPMAKIMLEQEQITTLETIFATKADLFPDEGVAKINVPRTDIQANVHGYQLSPFTGLTTWIGFQKGERGGIEIMAMGDIVLLEDEVDAALGTALEKSVAVTALHNHFIHEQPKIYFMHINAEGSTNDVSSRIKAILEVVKFAKKDLNKPYFHLIKNDITGSLVEQIIGVKGQAKDGMFKIVVGRQVYAGCGCTVGKNMGINTWVAFSGTDDHSVVDGDFVVFEDELQSVLKTLKKSGISVVAIHNHMVHERPRCLFVHYWGHGTVVHLAKSIKNALNETSTFGIDSKKHTKSCCNRGVR